MDSGRGECVVTRLCKNHDFGLATFRSLSNKNMGVWVICGVGYSPENMVSEGVTCKVWPLSTYESVLFYIILDSEYILNMHKQLTTSVSCFLQSKIGPGFQGLGGTPLPKILMSSPLYEGHYFDSLTSISKFLSICYLYIFCKWEIFLTENFQ